MTNKPMLSVERELILLLYRAINGGSDQLTAKERLKAWDELRALLDKPACGTCGAAILPDVMTGTACYCSKPPAHPLEPDPDNWEALGHAKIEPIPASDP